MKKINVMKTTQTSLVHWPFKISNFINIYVLVPKVHLLHPPHLNLFAPQISNFCICLFGLLVRINGIHHTSIVPDHPIWMPPRPPDWSIRNTSSTWRLSGTHMRTGSSPHIKAAAWAKPSS